MATSHFTLKKDFPTTHDPKLFDTSINISITSRPKIPNCGLGENWIWLAWKKAFKMPRRPWWKNVTRGRKALQWSGYFISMIQKLSRIFLKDFEYKFTDECSFHRFKRNQGFIIWVRMMNASYFNFLILSVRLCITFVRFSHQLFGISIKQKDRFLQFVISVFVLNS